MIVIKKTLLIDEWSMTCGNCGAEHVEIPTHCTHCKVKYEYSASTYTTCEPLEVVSRQFERRYTPLQYIGRAHCNSAGWHIYERSAGYPG